MQTLLLEPDGNEPKRANKVPSKDKNVSKENVCQYNSYFVSLETGLSFDLQSAGDSFSDTVNDKINLFFYPFLSFLHHIYDSKAKGFRSSTPYGKKLHNIA